MKSTAMYKRLDKESRMTLIAQEKSNQAMQTLTSDNNRKPLKKKKRVKSAIPGTTLRIGNLTQKRRA